MTCEAKHQLIHPIDTSKLIEYEKKRVSDQIEVYDEEVRKYRKHMEQQEALRQLEQIKTRALASVYGLSFIR